DPLVGQQVPGLTPLAGPRDHQPERLGNPRVCDGQYQEAGPAEPAALGNEPLVLAALAAGDLPRLPFLTLYIEEPVVLRPAQDEAHMGAGELLQPGRAGEAAIEDVQHPPAPCLDCLAQEVFLLPAPRGGKDP